MPNDDPQDHNAFLKDRKVDDYIMTVMKHIQGCQKLSSELQGWQHYQDYAGVSHTMAEVNARITSLISKIFQHQDITVKVSHKKLLDQFDKVREGNDALLERINSDIDEASGLKKNNMEDLLPAVKTIQSSHNSPNRGVVLMAPRNIQKPQLFFTQKINNSKKEPFIPFLREKPNSMKPLAVMLCIDDFGMEYYSHPYEYELQHWNPDPKRLEPVNPTQPLAIGDTSLDMIQTPEELNQFMAEVKGCSEIAVDLEHHAFRSYQGLTCLIQVSTRQKDYIIDPIALRGKLTILNEVFTDPKVTKVLHGSDFDVLWLQRDCGVYVVNLFDTHQAAVVLEYPHRSLKALLDKFCNIQADKVYQRADWRIRPLPEDFIHYARQDTHYLLYVYDLLRNELIERGNQVNNLINAVYTRSTDICMKRYEKPFIGPDSHMDLYNRSRKTFNARQMHAFRELYQWRDKVAREQDECPDFVLPKHMMLSIAGLLPKEMQGILSCCNPIPPLVKTELLTLHTIIRVAREQKLDAIFEASQQPINTADTLEDVGFVIKKHDLSAVDENPVDLPTLLEPRETLLGDLFAQHKVEVAVTAKSQMFHCKKEKMNHQYRSHLEAAKDFMSPYERYMAYQEIKPLLEEEERKNKQTGEEQERDRLERVRAHYMSLTKKSPTKPETVLLQEKIKEHKQRNRPHKRPADTQEAAEEDDDSPNKKSKSESSQEGSSSSNGKIEEERVSQDSEESTGDEEDQEMDEEEALADQDSKDGEVSATASDTAEPEITGEFDYENADYSIFQKKAGKTVNKTRGVKSRFKMKGSQGRGRMNKTNMKSFSWGGGSGRGRGKN